MSLPASRARLALLVLAGLLVAAPGAAQPSEIEIGAPAPAWAEAIEVPAPRGDEGGVERLLHDQQWRLDEHAQAAFTRIAHRVTTTAGLRASSEIAIEVGSSERLAWHWARRTRDGARTELLARDRVRIIQPEARRGEGLYDETREAVLLLDDVRVGDVIEYAYTITQGIGVLGGRHAARAGVGRPGVRRVHFEARWPADRPIRAVLREAPAAYAVTQGPGVLRIDALDVPLPEDEAPSQSDVGHPWVELSEFADWAEVARWAEPLYRVADLDAALADVPMAAIRAAGDVEAQIAAALRFVQDDVRYLGLEIADNALVPHAPAEVARRRYGDCKDKALLLVTILRALGVAAEPALTSTQRRGAIAGDLPSPFAFDHVVVRVHLDDGPIWVDGTRTFERGPLRARPPVWQQRALPIGIAEGALVEVSVAPATEPTHVVDERYVVDGPRSTLRVTTVYRGGRAALLRQWADEGQSASIGERALGFYRDQGLDARVLEPLRIEDEEHTGGVTVHERYTIDRFWDGSDRQLDAWSALEWLDGPASAPGRGSISVPHPAFVVHRISVANDRGWRIDDEDERIESDAFVMERRVRVAGRELRLEVHLRTLADQVPEDRVEAHREALERARALAFYSVIEHAEPSLWERASGVLCLGALVLLIGGSLAARSLRARIGTRRKRAFRAKQRFARGESAQDAIEVADREDAERAHRAPRCCGAPLEDAQWSAAQLGGERIFVAALTCPTCGTIHRTYYRQRAVAASSRQP